jgi:DNA-binding transcriptional ArsR family regulator
MTEPIENVDDPRLVRALSHPLRVRILAILGERTASPIEISRMLRADIGVVAYHVRTLHRLGLLDLEREVPVRGAIQRFYRARERPTFSKSAWAKAPPVAKQALIAATIQQIHEFADGSNAYGGFDRADAHITRTPMRLDQEGFERLAELLMEVLRAADEIERQVAERQGVDSPPDLFDAGLAMMLFEATPFSLRPAPSTPEVRERNSPTRAATVDSDG